MANLSKEAKRLKALRKKWGLTTREFAEKFLVSHSTIVLWENGERKLPGPAIMLLSLYEKQEHH